MTEGLKKLMETAPLYTDAAEGPSNGKGYWVKTDDGVRIRAAHWPEESKGKGTILLLPGRADYIENYGRTVADFVAIGYSLVAIDWRGQGLSDRLTENRKLGHVRRFSDYQSDLRAVVDLMSRLSLPRPWFMIGHSMGGCIGLRALLNGLDVAACAFTAPMWQIKLSTLERIAACPGTWLAHILGLGRKFAPGFGDQTYVLQVPFEENTMTHDAEMYAYWIRQAKELKDLPIGGPSLGWLYQSLKECKDLSNWSLPSTPCITFCGENDAIVELEAIKDRLTRWPESSLHLLPSARHEIFLELPQIRVEVTGRIDEFFVTHSGAHVVHSKRANHGTF